MVATSRIGSAILCCGSRSQSPPMPTAEARSSAFTSAARRPKPSGRVFWRA